MTTEDDPENDPLLTSMRSVWLGMRDEDPPARGLAELMAAARTQAAAMKPAEKDPWWRRSLAFLLRPPVLAAAAVVVVVGGAVALTGRGGSENVALPQVETGLKQRDEDRAGRAPTEAERTVKADVAPTTQAPPTEAPGDLGGRDQAHMESLTTKPKVPPTVVSQTTPRPTPKTDPGAVSGSAAPQQPPPPPPPPPEPDNSLVIAGEGEATDGKTKQPTVDRQPGRQPAPAKNDADDLASGPKLEGTKDVRGASTDQLVKQAETAANRGDCAAVRATVARIKKASPETYKTRVANQPAIARCLP